MGTRAAQSPAMPVGDGVVMRVRAPAPADDPAKMATAAPAAPSKGKIKRMKRADFLARVRARQQGTGGPAGAGTDLARNEEEDANKVAPFVHHGD